MAPDEGKLAGRDTPGPDGGSPSPGGLCKGLELFFEFWESTERVLSVLAGLVLAVLCCLMPFSALGAEEPWYFWVGSGLIALAVSVLLAWVFFPLKTSGKGKPRRDEKEEDGVDVS